MKEEMKNQGIKKSVDLKPIHMPKNSGIPFIMSVFWFIAGFGLTFHWVWMAIFGLIGVAGCMLARSFQYDSDYYIPVDEIKSTEASLGRVV
jgi:cytochrome aa3-600 menaquinol oxidase subunit 1